MAKMGRPKKEIDPQIFEGLCAIMCTEEEIAGVLRCSIDTINNWCKSTYGETFSDVSKKHANSGKASLRRMQFRLAEKSPAMAIWLGKQYLGQRDTMEITHDGLDKVADLMKALDAEADVK